MGRRGPSLAGFAGHHAEEGGRGISRLPAQENARYCRPSLSPTFPLWARLCGPWIPKLSTHILSPVLPALPTEGSKGWYLTQSLHLWPE